MPDEQIVSISCAGGCLVAIFYYGMITCLPAFFMRIISRRLNVHPNSILHADKRTFRDRSVVIPCPDFLYSTVNVDLSINTDAILFTAPHMVYGSLGLYDDMARCVDIANHSHSSLKALVINPQVVATDEELHELYPNTRILRLPSSTGLLLHRFLMPSPADYPVLRQHQLDKVKSEVVHLPKKFTTNFSSCPSLLVKFFLSLLWSPVTAMLIVPLGASLSSSRLTLWNLSFTSSLILLVLVSFIIALPLVLITLKVLKKPSLVAKTGIMTLSQIRLWKFNTLEAFGDLSASHPQSTLFRFSTILPTHLFEPFRNLVFFLHGALGLTPKEVQYGGTLRVYSSSPPPSFPSRRIEAHKCDDLVEYIRYDGSYAVDIPSLSLACEWWSVTLYGHDLFLLPNQSDLYSVNSYELQSIHESITSSLSDSHPSVPLPPITYRIISSPKDPQIPRCRT